MLSIMVENIGRGTKPHILASCQVTLTSEGDGDELELIKIVDVRVLKNRSGELFIGYPTQDTKDWEGVWRHSLVIDFSRELKKRISDAVLAEFEKDDARYAVAAEAGCPAVRPAVKPIRQA